MREHFKLPDVGEGLTEAEIVTWRVAPGDTVAVNDVIVEIETAKAAVELPSPWAGTVGELLAEPGATVAVGTPIIAIDTGGSAPDAGADTGAKIGEAGRDGRIATLVGYGPRQGSARRRPRREPTASTAPGSVAAGTPAPPAPGPGRPGPGAAPSRRPSSRSGRRSRPLPGRPPEPPREPGAPTGRPGARTGRPGAPTGRPGLGRPGRGSDGRAGATRSDRVWPRSRSLRRRSGCSHGSSASTCGR
ncbi:biotin/lipoyl-containing protein [Pseudonocardia alni]|uniref:biotin/lipoyl-containing protein n=1 Tax=Pseudonocardia alni TaxID=33907 RepID=UPI0027A1A4EA|nr:hypothetical protein PaSha_11130 [Pseudonocardia alni]